MGYTHGTTINDKTRVCTKCNNEFPNTEQYFNYANKKIGRLSAACKECTKRINKERKEKIKQENLEKKLFYEGTKKCIKCGRNLPNNKLFFPIDLTCKTGLRNKCRECDEKNGRFLEPDYKIAEKWTEEEIKLLKEVYNDHTGLELVDQFFPNRTLRALESQASILGIAFKTEETKQRAYNHQAILISEKFKGRDLGQEWKDKISATKKEYFKTHDGWWKGKKRTKEQCEQISKRRKESGAWNGGNNPRHINPLNGELNGRWKGGITDVYKELRSDTKDWFNDSMQFCNYHCVITSGEFDNVHHTTAFKDIVDETFRITGLDVRQNVCDYTEDEFQELRDVLKKLHCYFGYGACINKKVHKLFHDNYGYTKFTPYDFLDFCYRIDNGDFSEWFNTNNLEVNINYNYIEYLENILLDIDEELQVS